MVAQELGKVTTKLIFINFKALNSELKFIEGCVRTARSNHPHSSMYGCFFENGPYRIKPNGDLYVNDHAYVNQLSSLAESI